jgi:hypothetical protein
VSGLSQPAQPPARKLPATSLALLVPVRSGELGGVRLGRKEGTMSFESDVRAWQEDSLNEQLPGTIEAPIAAPVMKNPKAVSVTSLRYGNLVRTTRRSF